jgi:large subunit ribosomal protein L2
VRPNEGDAYPIGSLSINTVVSSVEINPGAGGFFARGAGTYCTILRKIGQRVVFAAPSKREYSVEQMCMAVVGMNIFNISFRIIEKCI